MVYTDSLPHEQKKRIESYFYNNYGHLVNGHAWLFDRLQVKLRIGAPVPPVHNIEGIPIEYTHEEAFAISALDMMSMPFKSYYMMSQMHHSAYTRWNEQDYDNVLNQYMVSLQYEQMTNPVAIVGGTTTENVPCRRCYHEIIRGGISTGNTRTGSGSGTLGGIAWRKSDGAPVMISNYHVWCVNNFQIGDRVSQPSRPDATSTNSDYVHIGKLAKYAPVKIRTQNVTPQPVDNYIDCAYSTFLDLSTQKRTLSVIDLGPQKGFVREAVKGLAVAKSGRTTQTTFGTVMATDVKIKVNNYPLPTGSGSGFAYFGGLIQTTEMIHGGDSGSFLFNNNNKNVIGLGMAGGVGAPSYACDIVRVAEALGVKGLRPTSTSPSIELPIGGGIEINPIVAGVALGGAVGMIL